MKVKFNLSNIEVAGISIGGIEVETEMTLVEIVGLRKEQEHILQNADIYLEQIASIAKKCISIEKEVTEAYRDLY